jgi:hypothetical protein
MVRITLKTTLTNIQKSHPGPTRRNRNRLFRVLIHPRRGLPIGAICELNIHTPLALSETSSVACVGNCLMPYWSCVVSPRVKSELPLFTELPRRRVFSEVRPEEGSGSHSAT